MKRIELLAPAGNFDALKAAVCNGADAVYLGGKNFGARAFAGNFDHEELAEAVKYAHYNGVKVYMTLNTLLNEYELENAKKEVQYAYETGVDALLVQDLGLYSYVKENYPDFPLHASTQMHIHNSAGVETARLLGFERAVVARETSLDLIRQFCKQGIEIEVFVHGALCVSYSGQCLLSSSLNKRSGNKGMCAQTCRTQFIDDSNDKRYYLSTHDLNAIKALPELIEAGVSCLKIEGRMKKAAYVAYITRLYRQAIDAYYEGKEFKVDEEMLKNMMVLFNRGFTDAYLYDRGASSLYDSSQPNHRGIPLGKVTGKKKNFVYIKLEEDLAQFDGIRFVNQKDGFIVNKLYDLNRKLINGARKGETVLLEYKGYLQNGEKCVKTTDYKLEKELADLKQFKRFPLNIRCSLHKDEKVTMTLETAGYKVSATAPQRVEESKKAPMNEESVRKAIDHLRDTPYYLQDFLCDIDENIFVPVSVLKELRRRALTQLDELRCGPHRKSYPVQIRKEETAYLCKELCETDAKGNEEYCTLSENEGTADYLLYPVVNPYSEYTSFENVAVSELGGLLVPAKHKIAYYTLNCANSTAYRFLRSLGFEAVILSSELDPLEISNMSLNGEFHYFRSGRRDLMNLKYRPCIEGDSITQSGEVFPVVKRKNRYVLLENKEHGIKLDEGYAFVRKTESI